MDQHETAYRHGIDPCGKIIPKTAEETIRWLEARVKGLESELADWKTGSAVEAREADSLRIQNDRVFKLNEELLAENAELAAVVRAAYLHVLGKLDERAQENLGAALARLGSKGSDTQAPARHAAGEPAKHPDTERLEAIEDGGLDVFESDGEWYVGAAEPCRTLRAAIDAAAAKHCKEVQS